MVQPFCFSSTRWIFVAVVVETIAYDVLILDTAVYLLVFKLA